ncbi:MAG: glycosyltransferase family 4 protein [Candidatus Nanoarchaeia archaeon]
MKIAIIYDMIYPFSIGGAEIRNYEISKIFLKNGHEVHLYGIKSWKGPKVIKKEGLILHGICKYGGLYNQKGERKIIRQIEFAWALLPELLKNNFDIIDTSSLGYFHCFTTALACKIKKIPLIITWHQYFSDYWYLYLGKTKGNIGKIIENLTLRLTKNNLAVSKTTKKEMLKNKAKEVFLNYNGVNLKEIKKINKENNLYDVIFAGRLINQKNVSLLLEATKLLKKDFKNIKVAIIGEGPDKKRLIELSKELKIEENIDFLGFLKNKKEVYRIMKKSKVFVLPSLLEGFGIVVIEANACGLPCIVVNEKWNASKELIKNNYNGFIVENIPENLYEKIKSLLNNRDLLKKMSRNSIKFSENFDWDNIAKDLQGYYLKKIKKFKNI